MDGGNQSLLLADGSLRKTRISIVKSVKPALSARRDYLDEDDDEPSGGGGAATSNDNNERTI
jgi:hypothetical protein